MATYQIGLTDNIQETRPQGGSYQFLQQLQPFMDKANQQYEEGLSNVMSGYSNIVNAPVTGIEAQERKRKYVQDAQGKLRTLSTQNLLLPQNVLQAETAYAPFWQDDALLTNMSGTRDAYRVKSTLESWRDSTDKDIRDQYSDTVMMDVSRYLEELGNAPMSVDAYRKIEPPRAVVGANIPSELTNQYIKEFGAGLDKGAIATITTKGLAMNTEFNGPNAVDGYKTWALAHMGSNYDEYLRIEARVKVWQEGKMIKAENPGMTDQQVNEKLAESRMSYLREKAEQTAASYKKMADDEYGRNIRLINQQVNEYQNGKKKPEQEDALKYNEARLQLVQNEYNNYMAAIESKYSPTIKGIRNEAYYKELNDIATNPVGYLMNAKKFDIADQWAIGKASITQEKREVDPVQKEIEDNARKDRQWTLDFRKQRFEEQKERDAMTRAAMEYGMQTGLDFATQKKLPGYMDALMYRHPDAFNDLQGGGVGSSQNIAAGASSGVIGRGTAEVTKIPDMLAVVKGDIQQNKNSYLSNIFDTGATPGGGKSFGNIVLGEDGVGLNMEQMSDFTNMMQRMRSGPANLSAEERVVYDKVKKTVTDALSSIGIKPVINGPNGMAGALELYAEKIVTPGLQKVSDNTDKLNTLLSLAEQRTNLLDTKNRYTTAEEKLNREINTKILTSPTFNSITYTDNNGKKNVVDEQYIENILPKNIRVRDANGKRMTIKAKDIAEAYINGMYSLEQTGIKNADVLDWNDSAVKITVGDKNYDIIADDIDDAIKLRDATNKINRVHGNSEAFSKRKQEAGQLVATDLGIKDGLIYKNQKFDMNAAKMGDKRQEQFLHNYLSEAASPANTYKLYYTDPVTGKRESIDEAEDIANIRAALSSVNARSNNVASVTRTKNDNMEDVIEIEWNGPNEAGLTSDNAKAADNISKFRDKKVSLTLSTNAQGKYLNAVTSPILNEPWGGLYEGQKFRSNPIQEGVGFTYTAVPVNQGPEGYNAVNVEYTMLVQDGNKFVPKTYQRTAPLSGDRKKTASEIQQIINNLFITHMSMVNAQKKSSNATISQSR